MTVWPSCWASRGEDEQGGRAQGAGEFAPLLSASSSSCRSTQPPHPTYTQAHRFIVSSEHSFFFFLLSVGWLVHSQTCVLKVNIHCDGCEKKVKKILHKIDGNKQTNILLSQIASFFFFKKKRKTPGFALLYCARTAHCLGLDPSKCLVLLRFAASAF